MRSAKSNARRAHDVLHQFQVRRRRRRHCTRHLGHARPLDERDRRQGRSGARCHHRARQERCRHQGRGRHLGQGQLQRRRRSELLGIAEPGFQRNRQARRRGGGDRAAVRAGSEPLAVVPTARNLRQAVGRRHQRHRARRRAGALPRLSLPGRGGQSQDPRRAPRDQGRAVPRRRRHAAHRSDAAARGRVAGSAQGRPDPARSRQIDEARRRGRARR